VTVDRGGRSADDERRRAGAHEQCGDEIQAVVLEHRFERLGPPVARELEEPRRDLEARHIAYAVHTGQPALEHAERATRVIDVGSDELGTIPPKATGGVQRVEVRHIGPRPLHALEGESHLQQRHIERAAVEGQEVRAVLHPLAETGELSPLVLESRRQELPDVNPVAFDPGTADEKRLRAGATGQSGGLEVEHAEPVDRAIRRAVRRQSLPRPGTTKQRQAVLRASQRVNEVADPPLAVTRVGLVASIDDEARPVGAQLDDAAERGCRALDPLAPRRSPFAVGRRCLGRPWRPPRIRVDARHRRAADHGAQPIREGGRQCHVRKGPHLSPSPTRRTHASTRPPTEPRPRRGRPP
jgi:hypothetical protein